MQDTLAGQTTFQWLARFGFVMRGVLYIVIAWLVIVNGRTEDLTGALEYLGHGVGKALTEFHGVLTGVPVFKGRTLKPLRSSIKASAKRPARR